MPGRYLGTEEEIIYFLSQTQVKTYGAMELEMVRSMALSLGHNINLDWRMG